MKVRNSRKGTGFALSGSRMLLVSIVLGFGLSGCASKATKEPSAQLNAPPMWATSEEQVPGNDWERELLAGVDLEYFTPEQLAQRVAAAREHALNIARESEDATLYAALTGGRDLYQDIATERALALDGLGDGAADYATNPNRDYTKRGFFNEEQYAFDSGLTDAERIAARVEAARRFAGLDATDDQPIMAFSNGTYSRIYNSDADVSGLMVADGNGNVTGWASPGEVTADGTRFAAGASERSLGNSQLAGNDGFSGKKGSRRERNGAIDVAAARANVNEEIIPQTLGGALPMVLGVDENGHFDFDTYVLRDEVRVKLDVLVQQLQDAEFDRLDVVGYSDRIGEYEYNKDLSRKRAQAVAQYLRDNGVPEYKIKVAGRGSENPLTNQGDCEGLRGQEKINCLQPDRRVEIAASIRRVSVETE